MAVMVPQKCRLCDGKMTISGDRAWFAGDPKFDSHGHRTQIPSFGRQVQVYHCTACGHIELFDAETVLRNYKEEESKQRG